MLVKKSGIYSIKKDGSSYYRIFRKRTRVASFLLLSDAEAHMEKLIDRDKSAE